MSKDKVELERCNVCEEELIYPGNVGPSGVKCDRCQVCPFCNSNFTVINLNGVVVERRCMKCNAYTETYLDN